MKPDPAHDAASDDAGTRTPHELAPRARTSASWCGALFLAASGATMILFAFLDLSTVELGATPPWWTTRHAVYALGFFWLTAACSAALAIYMAHTDRK